MTKKSEMAEWILDFFRRAKVDAGQIVLFRSIQHKVYELNPKERELFVLVVNELIKNGYFTYEEGTPQCLRLTEKGRNYIYNPDATLDSCLDRRKATKNDYLKAIKIGVTIAETVVQGQIDNNNIGELLKQACQLIESIDDKELLIQISRYVVVIKEMKSGMSEIIWNQEVKEAVEGAINHLERLGEEKIVDNLKQLI